MRAISIRALIKYWPRANYRKECMFWNLLHEIVEFSFHVDASIAKGIFKMVARYVTDPRGTEKTSFIESAPFKRMVKSHTNIAS